MKNITLILVFLIGINTVFYAQNCKVKDKLLTKKYEGDCKKGLAHGQGKAWGNENFYEGNFKKGRVHGEGTYTWNNGNVYKGSFVKGKFDGKGVLTENNITKKGYFKKGKYIGKYKRPYKIVSKRGIRTVNFIKQPQDFNEVEIKIYENGALIKPQIRITDTNNTFVEKSNNLVFKDVSFPLKKVELFFTANSFSYSLVFEIYQKGNWKVNITL